MKRPIALILVLASTTVYAGKKKEHRHHEAHVHGGATLNIAFNGLKGTVEFKAASEGVIGFEYEAKSAEDKKKLSDAMTKFESSIGSMVKFDESAGCVFVKDKIEVVPEKEDHDAKGKKHDDHEGEHSDFIAHFSVNCQKDIKMTKLEIDFDSVSGLNDLDVTVLVGDLQKSEEAKRDKKTKKMAKISIPLK